MSRPIPGENYTVKPGDNLWNLASMAYGDPWKWEDIHDANELILTESTPNKWGYIMQPGDVIFIPGDKEKASLLQALYDFSAEDAEPDEMTIVIDDEELPVTAGRITRTMDTPADGFTASTYFDPMSEIHQRIFRPMGYQRALAYLGKQIQVTGALYKPKTSSEISTGSTIQLHAFTGTADIIDTTLKPPYVQKKVTLEERIRALVEPRGFNVIWNATGDDVDKKFRKVKASKTEKIFAHLRKLAKQRGVVISSNEVGDIVVDDVASLGSVGSIVEGKGSLRTLSAEWDGRQIYSTYTAYGSGPKKNVKAFSRDTNVARSRMFAFSANETDGDDIQGAADYKRNSALARALTLQLPVTSWYAPDGELWKPNSLVTIEAPTLFLPDGFEFLIKQVEFAYANEGVSAVLSVLPPSVYTRDELVNPWAKE